MKAMMRRGGLTLAVMASAMTLVYLVAAKFSMSHDGVKVARDLSQ